MTAIPDNERGKGNFTQYFTGFEFVGWDALVGWCHLPANHCIYPYERFWDGSEIRCILLGKDPSSIGGSWAENLRAQRYQTQSGLLIANPLIHPRQNNQLGDKDAVPGFLEVDLSGLGGDFATYNGTHLCAFTDSALHGHWEAASVDVWIRLHTDASENVAEVSIYGTDHDCNKFWEKNLGADLDFEGKYSESKCDDYDCTDTDTCYKSSGATCKVRYYGATWP